MSQYIDAIEKINYYKERIMRELTRSGIYPDSIAVNERLADFDAELALFTHNYISAGESFDTAQFNEEFAMIVQDLKILYKLVYQLSVKNYQETKEYAESHVSELQNMAKRYQYKTKFEIDSTSLGTTVYFKSGGFDISLDNTTAKISLGSLEVNNGASLACIFNADDIRPENVVFSFDGKNCSPYDLNRDFFKVDGELGCKIHSYSVSEDEVINSAHVMNIKEFVPNAQNKYVIYAGSDQIQLQNGFAAKTDGTPMLFGTPGELNFYVLGGTFINFDFSKAPLSKNFNGTSIENLAKHHKITMEYEAGFALDFVTDGTIYATRKAGVVNKDRLYYPAGDSVYDFRIEEYLSTEKKKFKDVSVTISGLKEDIPLTVNTVAIKQLSVIEGAEDV